MSELQAFREEVRGGSVSTVPKGLAVRVTSI